LKNSTMEKFRKSVNICQSCGQKYRGPFFWLTVYNETEAKQLILFFCTVVLHLRLPVPSSFLKTAENMYCRVSLLSHTCSRPALQNNKRELLCCSFIVVLLHMCEPHNELKNAHLPIFDMSRLIKPLFGQFDPTLLHASVCGRHFWKYRRRFAVQSGLWDVWLSSTEVWLGTLTGQLHTNAGR